MPGFWRHTRPSDTRDESLAESTAPLGCLLTLLLMMCWLGLVVLSGVAVPAWLQRFVLLCADFPILYVLVASLLWGQFLAWLIGGMRAAQDISEPVEPDDAA